jgi:RNA polymerase sigma factor (sigma-70 family)
MSALLDHLRRLVPGPAAAPDAELLRRYARDRDEDAFAALVHRHGRMVWGVCRRALADPRDAEDAFQAAFLVLARKASSVRPPGRVAAWLHGVARRIALKACSAGGRALIRLAPLPEGPPAPGPGPPEELAARELLRALEEEVGRLPEAQRMPVVLCCLDGLSQEEAAARLGCTPGAVRGRLERGRKRLYERLVRRGLALSAALAAAAAEALAGAAPAGLLNSAARAAPLFAAGQAAGTVPGAAALAEEALRAMLHRKIKGAVLALLLVGALGLAGGGHAYRGLAVSEAPRDAAGREGPAPLGVIVPVERPAEAGPADLAELAERLKERAELPRKLEALRRQEEDVRAKVGSGPTLERELARLRRLIDQTRAKLDADPREGVVTEVSREGTVWLGLRRPEAVRPGGALLLFSQGPRPEYLGRVKVLRVKGAVAVTEVVSQVGLIRPGDLAAAPPARAPARPAVGKAQVRFIGPAGATLRLLRPGAREGRPLRMPGRRNLPPGLYRLELSDLPARPGVKLYPTLELPPAGAGKLLAHVALPVAFTEEDLDQAVAGGLVVKVLYLPEAKFREAAAAPGEIVSSRLEPGVDPILEARRRGRILAVVRLGNIDLGEGR